VKIAVLGHRGMLGRRVVEEFTDSATFFDQPLTFDERYSGELHDPLLDAIEAADPDWIIDCIGATYDEPDMWSVNAVLPHRLAHRWRTIVPSTDHVWDDTDYARSKRLGETGHVIRCAIVDPDGGILARAREGDTHGSVNREWNGITTKWWARIAREIIEGRYTSTVVPGSPTIKHFDLLEIARRTFGWTTKTLVDRSHHWHASKPSVMLPPIEEQLAEYL
jgi:dTDP-4-dehydrorhamnose reductase